MSNVKVDPQLKKELLAVLTGHGGLPTSLYEKLGERMSANDVNRLTQGKIPDAMPSEVIELILGKSRAR